MTFYLYNNISIINYLYKFLSNVYDDIDIDDILN